MKGKSLIPKEKQMLGQMEPLLDAFIEYLNVQIEELNRPYPTPKWPYFST